MARLFPVTNSSVVASVTATVAAAHSALVAGTDYQFVSSTNCWIRQGSSKLLTVVAKANLIDGETVTITVNGTAVVYEFDVNGTGVTAGRVQVNVSADTTAATVAARLKTAINANQATLTVTDPLNGTLVIDLPSVNAGLSISDTVADAGFTNATGTMQATAATGSMFVPAGYVVLLNGSRGGQLGVLRDSADGKSSTAPVMII